MYSMYFAFISLSAVKYEIVAHNDIPDNTQLGDVN